jgi:hypothetical protein
VCAVLSSGATQAVTSIDLEFDGYGPPHWETISFAAFGGNYSLWDSNFAQVYGFLDVTMSSKAVSTQADGKVGYRWTGAPFDPNLDLTIETAFQMSYPWFGLHQRGSAFLEVFDGESRIAMILTSSGLVLPTVEGYTTVPINLEELHTYRVTSFGNSNQFDVFVDSALVFSGAAPASSINGFQFGTGGAVWDPEGPGVDMKLDYISISQNQTITSSVPEPETYAMFLAGLGLMGFMARRRKNGQV